MPFVKGQSGNPQGLGKGDKQAITRIRLSINKALDKFKHGEKVGLVAFQEKIASSLETDFLPTLKAIAPFLPKDITIENNKLADVNKLTDDQLADIVARRARQKREAIEGEYQEIAPIKDASTHN